MSSVKSFKRVQKEPRVNVIPGTKFSPNNFSLLTSTGLTSFDTLLGGGLPVGALLLIEEDQYGHYAETIAKHFIAEGILSKHHTYLASQDTDLDQLLSNLPGPVEEGRLPSSQEDRNAATEEMTIAWRYKNMKVADSSISGKSDFGHKLQINTPLDPEYVKMADITRHNFDENGNIESTLGRGIHDALQDTRHVVESDSSRQVLRLALLNVGSPLWSGTNVTQLLYSLRAWLRSSVAVGLVTVPSHLHKNNTEAWKWIEFADICIKLDSFAGSARAQNPALKDYHGFFHIVKLPAFNSIAPFIPPSDLAFKLRRRKFVIERLSLPPELEDTSARGEGEKMTGCGGAVGSNLDF